ncbi:MAG: PAS domain-containing protein [Gammaproteobacteria bacterium]|nr:PAS domain-containing protein [Gammaproteobacteria bacterium]
MNNSNFLLVGIGASAGGLEALQGLLESLPKKTNTAFVIAQHLSPSHVSMLRQILTNHCVLPVIDITEQEKIKPNCVYVCPAAHDVIVKDGYFQVNDKDKEAKRHYPSPSVDKLFESIAANWQGEKAGIILSGTGRDGSSGLLSIRFHGGITASQNIESAKYDGMPSSAQRSVHVDVIAEPEKIYNKIIDFKNRVETISQQEAEHKTERDMLYSILDVVDTEFGTSFTKYKTGTTFRRVYSRMATINIESIAEYASLVQKDTKERRRLLQNMLIGVTDFFRDFSVFLTFQDHLKAIIHDKESKSVRAWVAGCSRGQEAYSVAMILHELIGGAIKDWDIKIFATDIDEAALDYARAGLYNDKEVEGIPQDYLKTYFYIKNGQYQVEKSIRECIVFSRHDLTIDPPYVKLDVITCRNVLIYFQEQLQVLVHRAFHYALQPSGMLLLGRSESLGSYRDSYDIIDANAKIFKARTRTNIVPSGFKTYRELKPLQLDVKSSRSSHSRNTESLSNVMYESIVKSMLPYNVLTDSADNVIYTSANNPFLGFQDEGIPSTQLPSLVHSDLQLALRIVNSELKEKAVARSGFTKVTITGQTKMVQVVGITVPSELELIKDEELKIFSFVEHKEGLPESGGNSTNRTDAEKALAQLEAELTFSRNESKQLLLELDEKNEELQVANEEMQSTNEELQSSNEELASTNEELEATVEELETAYAALRAAYDDVEKQTKALEDSEQRLKKLNADFRRAQVVAQIGHYQWDLKTNEIVWSEQMYDIFELTPNSPVTMEYITSRVASQDRALLEKEIETSQKTGRFNLKYRIRKSHTPNGVAFVHGQGEIRTNEATGNKELVGTVQVIDDLIALEDKANQFEKELAKTISNSLTGIYVYNFELQSNTFINKRYTQITGYTFDDLNKMNSEEFMALFHPDDVQNVASHMEEVINSSDSEVLGLKYRFKHKQGHYVTLYSQDSVTLRNITGEPLEFTGSFIDISEQDLREKAVANFEFMNTSLGHLYGVALVNTDGVPIDVNQGLLSMLGYTKEELTTKSFKAFTHEEDYEKDLALFNQLIKQEISSYQIDKRYIAKDGKVVMANLNVTGIFSYSGELSYILAMVEKL